MFKKLNNKRGEIILVTAIAYVLICVGASAAGGTLKKNGKLIWCKMQNKGNDYCDAMYR